MFDEADRKRSKRRWRGRRWWKRRREGRERGSDSVALRHINPCMLVAFYYPQGGVSGSARVWETNRRHEETQQEGEQEAPVVGMRD